MNAFSLAKLVLPVVLLWSALPVQAQTSSSAEVMGPDGGASWEYMCSGAWQRKEEASADRVVLDSICFRVSVSTRS
jgi:hypothetical protein